MRIEGTSLGLFRTEVKVEYKGGYRIVELVATVVSQSLEVLLNDENKILDSTIILYNFILYLLYYIDIHFGSIYFGQERQFTACIVNNGPHPSSFSTTIESKTEDEEMLMYFTEVTMEPSEGTIDALSKMDVVFKFTPIEIDPQFEFLMKSTPLRSKNIFSSIRDYNRTISIGVIETGQTIDIPVTGKVQ
jgi:hypothetical protein